MLSRTQKPRRTTAPASLPLGSSESLLVACAKKRHDRNTPRSTSGTQLAAALLGVKDKTSNALPCLPELICDMIETQLDTQTKAALTETWVSRLSPAARQTVLDKAARAYGFTSRPGGTGWQNHLETLTSTSRILPLSHVAADVALAGLLMGSLKPEAAAIKYPYHYQIIMHAVEQDGEALEYASTTMQNDCKVAMRAVEQDGLALKYTSAALRGNRDVVMHAVEQNGGALCHASAALKDDHDVVMRAVRQYGLALKYASAALQSNREVVMCAVGQNGLALQRASAALQNNREVVMCAVGQNGAALLSASAALQDDRDVVMRAVEQNGHALCFASARQKNNRDVVMRAVEQDGRALRYASAALQSDLDLHKSSKRVSPPCIKSRAQKGGSDRPQRVLCDN